MRSKFFVGIDLLDFNIIQIAEIIGVQKKQLEIRLVCEYDVCENDEEKMYIFTRNLARMNESNHEYINKVQQNNHIKILEPVEKGVHHKVMESLQLYWAHCILKRNRRAMNTPTVVAVEQLRSNDVVFALSKDAKYKKVIEKFGKMQGHHDSVAEATEALQELKSGGGYLLYPIFQSHGKSKVVNYCRIESDEEAAKSKMNLVFVY